MSNMIPVHRDHLKRMLDAARRDGGNDDILAAYSVGEGEASDTGMWSVRRNGVNVTMDRVVIPLGEARVVVFAAPEKDGTAAPLRENAWALDVRMNGKWMRSMTVSKVTIPPLDYTSDGVLTFSAEFIAYENCTPWVEVKDDGTLDEKGLEGVPFHQKKECVKRRPWWAWG